MPIKSPRGVNLLQGELFSLLGVVASGATAGTNGTAVIYQGERSRILVVLDLTAAGVDANDTLDVYVDVSIDGTIWMNAIHFAQMLGTGGAKRYFAVLDPSNPGTSAIDVTSDAAAGVVRPGLFGAQARGRYVIVDPTGANAAFSFTLAAYAMGGPWG